MSKSNRRRSGIKKMEAETSSNLLTNSSLLAPESPITQISSRKAPIGFCNNYCSSVQETPDNEENTLQLKNKRPRNMMKGSYADVDVTEDMEEESFLNITPCTISKRRSLASILEDEFTFMNNLKNGHNKNSSMVSSQKNIEEEDYIPSRKTLVGRRRSSTFNRPSIGNVKNRRKTLIGSLSSVTENEIEKSSNSRNRLEMNNGCNGKVIQCLPRKDSSDNESEMSYKTILFNDNPLELTSNSPVVGPSTSNNKATGRMIQANVSNIVDSSDMEIETINNINILSDVTAFVEVYSEEFNISHAIKDVLERMGATVLDKFTKDVTHVVFKNGSRVTFDKAIKKGIHLVSSLWVEECRLKCRKVEESRFPSSSMEKYQDPLLRGKIRKPRSMQCKDFAEQEKESMARVKARHKRKLKQQPCITEEYSSPVKKSTSKIEMEGVNSPLFNLVKLMRTPHASTDHSETEEDYDTPLAQRLYKRIVAEQNNSPSPARSLPGRLRFDDTDEDSDGQNNRTSPVINKQNGGTNQPVKENPSSPMKRPKVVQQKYSSVYDFNEFENNSNDNELPIKNSKSPSSEESILSNNNNYMIESNENTAQKRKKPKEDYKNRRRSKRLFDHLKTQEMEPDVQNDKENSIETDSNLNYCLKLDVVSNNSVDSLNSPSHSSILKKMTKQSPSRRRSVRINIPPSSGVTPLAQKISSLKCSVTPNDVQKSKAKKTIQTQEPINNKKLHSTSNVSSQSQNTFLSQNFSTLSTKSQKHKLHNVEDIISQDLIIPLTPEHPLNDSESVYTTLSQNIPKKKSSKSIKSSSIRVTQNIKASASRISNNISTSKLIKSTSIAGKSQNLDMLSEVEATTEDDEVFLPTQSQKCQNLVKNKMYLLKQQDRRDSDSDFHSPPNFSRLSNKTVNSSQVPNGSITQFKKRRTRSMGLCLTSFHSKELSTIYPIIKKLGGFKIIDQVDENTTHVVCGQERRTLNTLLGIARGCWLLDVSWLYESLGNGQWITEEPFELFNFFPSAKINRERRINSNSKYRSTLFSGVGTIFLNKDCTLQHEDFRNLMELTGAIIVENMRGANIVICNSSKPAPIKGKITCVSDKWPLDCIQKHQIISTDAYILK